jgi:hypothetical protein
MRDKITFYIFFFVLELTFYRITFSFESCPIIGRRFLSARRRHRGERIKVQVLKVCGRTFCRTFLSITLKRIEVGENVKLVFGRIWRRDHRSVRGSSEGRRLEVYCVCHRQLVEVEAVFFEEVFRRLGEHRPLIRRSCRSRLVRHGRPVEAEFSVGRITIFVQRVGVAVSEIKKTKFQTFLN